MKFLGLLLIVNWMSMTVNGSQEKQSFIGLGQKPVCVYNGDYCKDKTDCCSKVCESNKCTPSNETAININDVNLPTQKVNSTLDNRFNQEETIKCQKTGSKCSSSLKCCNFLICEENVCNDRSVYVNGTETLNYNKTTTELDNRFNENESSAAGPTTVRKCSDLGEKCIYQSDCCEPYKCHSFLHHCVT